jgi:hypothetical protein
MDDALGVHGVRRDGVSREVAVLPAVLEREGMPDECGQRLRFRDDPEGGLFDLLAVSVLFFSLDPLMEWLLMSDPLITVLAVLAAAGSWSTTTSPQMVMARTDRIFRTRRMTNPLDRASLARSGQSRAPGKRSTWPR